MDDQWLNKWEILNDLAVVTGTIDGAENLTSIHDKPPIKAAELDDESELYLRMCGAWGGARRRAESEGTAEYAQPDLPNISKMLQMLYEAEDLPNHNETEDITKLRKQKLVISKLNPCVKEFVPKNMNSKNKSPEEDIHKKNVDNDEAKENIGNNNLVCKDANADTKSLEIRNFIETKRQIDETATKKIRKNVAMSSFLNINTNAESTSKSIKLLTPDDFLLEAKDKTPIDILMAENLARFQNEAHYSSKLVKEEANELKTEGSLNKSQIDPSIEVSPQEVQASIKKVNDWLCDPIKEELPKPKAPYLGPIVFSKKTTSSPKPDPETAKAKETSKQSSKSTLPYKPSSYAIELLKKFEKNAAKAAVANEDMWTKLQRELKERDEALRKKALEEERSRASPGTSGDDEQKTEKRRKHFRGLTTISYNDSL